MDVVLFRADAAALANLHGHAPAHDVPAGKILVGGRVAFHEPLALGIREIAALATGALEDSFDVGQVGALAAEVMAEAIVRAVRAARGLPSIPAARDLREGPGA